MVYQANSMKLKMISVILWAEANDVLLCKRIPDEEQGIQEQQRDHSLEQYLLLILKDRKVIRYLLSKENERFWMECFPYGEFLCILIPYREQRPLLKFWRSEIKGREQKEGLLRGLISLCMTARLPAPILYLLIDQRRVSIRRDGTPYFTFELDFSELDANRTEKDCMELSVRMLQELSDPEDKDETRMFDLIEKKLLRNHYQHFLDLYLDWKHPSVRKWEFSPSDKIKVRVFYFLAVMAAILLILLVIMIVSQLAYGDVPLLRMFSETFRKIGTEVLGR